MVNDAEGIIGNLGDDMASPETRRLILEWVERNHHLIHQAFHTLADDYEEGAQEARAAGVNPDLVKLVESGAASWRDAAAEIGNLLGCADIYEVGF